MNLFILDFKPSIINYYAFVLGVTVIDGIWFNDIKEK